MLMIRRVVGASMHPALRQGAIVLGLRWRRPRVGSIVVADMGGREIIKRVAKVGGQGYYLLGDNAGHSTDSRTYGWFSPGSIKSVIIGGR
jgi:type IV secretory pathway protease TraF